jgi:diguanylate cyclase (GGDEF)-like protein
MFMNIQNKHALTDALTGIYNRGAFTEYLAESIHGKSKGDKLYLIMMDINRFKLINDTLGHIMGDDALKATAKMLSRMTKEAGEGDFLARYGGDEFALVCYRQDRDDIEKFIADVKEESKALQLEIGMKEPITISIGYAEYHSYLYDTEEAFIEEADRRMYKDKEKSRQQEK